ncbi:hypothetical protein IU459_09485 [Nocardia amamiensis]|uniref:Uncharacterized protein n=1 Tax=Nocardia amamiensis TaxID=404578 RepID=A0ABS0CNB1_9NOCA|nr:hypothetical protein [Nocardia amamiensis]MBF6297776.1 hypothetical protein [Nocardia amamiensis]
MIPALMWAWRAMRHLALVIRAGVPALLTGDLTLEMAAASLAGSMLHSWSKPSPVLRTQVAARFQL